MADNRNDEVDAPMPLARLITEGFPPLAWKTWKKTGS